MDEELFLALIDYEKNIELINKGFTTDDGYITRKGFSFLFNYIEKNKEKILKAIQSTGKEWWEIHDDIGLKYETVHFVYDCIQEES